MRTAVANQRATLDDDPMIHRVLAGKYRIEERTGAGSMGAIYRARHVTLDKVVCVKIMHEDVARVPDLAARFEREARAASRLDHTCSVRVLDYGKESDGTMYIVMEFVDGRDLFELLADGPFAAERIVGVLGQTLSALAAAHDVGILHRDLKPENIMITTEVADDGSLHERVKVCDFGIAHVIEPAASGGRRITSKGFIIGTPEYMSPEQARADVTDARSDIYSVGILMFQLLTGRLPFEADSPVGVALKQLGEEPPRPRDLNPRAHPALEGICLRALRKAPWDRYASAREMRSAVCAALGGAGAGAGAGTMPAREERETLTEGCAPEPAAELSAFPLVRTARSRRFRSRRRAAVVLVAGACALAVSGLGVAHRHLRGPAGVAMATAAAALLDTARLPGMPLESAPEVPERVAGDGPVSLEVSVAPPAHPAVSPAAAPPPAATRAAKPVLRPVTPAPEPAPVTPPPPVAAAPAPAPASASPPLPTSAAASTPPPQPPPPPAPAPPPTRLARAAPAPAAAPYDRELAHVEVGAPLQVSGATSLAIQAAIAPTHARLDACYRDALPRISGSVAGAATLHVETDDVGVVRRAQVAGALASDVGACIVHAVIGGRVRNVDTGVASADLPLTYRPR